MLLQLLEPAVPPRYLHDFNLIEGYSHNGVVGRTFPDQDALFFMTSMTRQDPSQRTDGIAEDRRQDRRYDITLELRWKLIRRRKVRDNGTGKTIDLSSGGIFFEAHRQLPVGLNVELSIAWPILLHNSSPLQLLVSGRIVRVSGTKVAIRMTQHEFHTAGLPVGEREMLASGSRTPGALLSRTPLSLLGKIQ